MKYEIRILRCKKGCSNKYYQSFCFDGTGEESVAAVIDSLNTKNDLFDIDGNPAPKIMWSCSCNQGICGACSMVINKTPALACKTKLKSLKSRTVTLEPLTKFRTVADLEVDRASLYESPIIHGIWVEGKTEFDNRQFSLQYEASKCMKCGICVEVCPNSDIVHNGVGTSFAVDCYLKYVQSGDKSEKKRIKSEYSRNFAEDCSKSMACAEHCPAKIDIRKLVSYMNK